MICPHCNKEVEGYIGIKADGGLNLNLNNGCAGGVLNYTYTLNNAAANPVVAVPAGTSTILNAAGCANQQLSHYHTF